MTNQWEFFESPETVQKYGVREVSGPNHWQAVCHAPWNSPRDEANMRLIAELHWKFLQESSAARNLPDDALLTQSGTSELAGDTESGGDAKGQIIPPLKLHHNCHPSQLQENCRCNGYHCEACGQRWIMADSVGKYETDFVWNGRCNVYGCTCKFCFHWKRLNLGSGQRPFDLPWVNVDIQDKWMDYLGVDFVTGKSPRLDFVQADIRSMPMFKDGSAEIIVIWHACEHFGCGEANPVIQESYRILQPGGELIVATPDIRALAIGYLTGRIDEQIYLTNLYGAYMSDEADRHKWNFSQDGLVKWMASIAPWKSVEKWTGPRPDGTDVCTDWWMATAKAIK